jgi:tRNA 2-thiouridine synthesizing protein A
MAKEGLLSHRVRILAKVCPRAAALARFQPDPHNTRMSETLLDVKGMNCPLPVLRANRSLRSMAPGERLRVLATDRAAIADFRAFCQETGHALIAMSEEAGVLSFVIRRRPDPVPSGAPLKDT